MKPVVIHLACARVIVEATENNPGLDSQDLEDIEKVKQALLDAGYKHKDMIAIAVLCAMFTQAIAHHPEMAQTIANAVEILDRLHAPPLSPASQALLQQIVAGQVRVIIGMFWDRCPPQSIQRACVLCQAAIGTAVDNQQTIADLKLQPVCPRCFSIHLSTHAAGNTKSLIFGQTMSVDEGLRVMAALDEPNAGQSN